MYQQQQPSKPLQQQLQQEYEQPLQTVQPTMPTMPPQQQGYFQPSVPMQQPQPYYQPPMYAPLQPQVNVMVNQMIGVRRRQTSMAVRVLYFLFIGSWLGLLWGMTALFLICTFIGAPVGLVMLGKTGKILFL